MWLLDAKQCGKLEAKPLFEPKVAKPLKNL
jgi:hypothetical protein